MKTHSSFADWLAAVDALQPAGEVEEQAIARMLGLRIRQSAATASASRREPAGVQAEPDEAAVAEAAPMPETKQRRRLGSV